MSRYKIELRPAAARALRKLDPQVARRLHAAIALLAAGLAGCRQQTFMTEADYNGVMGKSGLIPDNLHSDLHEAITPAPGTTPKPPTRPAARSETMSP